MAWVSVPFVNRFEAFGWFCCWFCAVRGLPGENLLETGARCNSALWMLPKCAGTPSETPHIRSDEIPPGQRRGTAEDEGRGFAAPDKRSLHLLEALFMSILNAGRACRDPSPANINSAKSKKWLKRSKYYSWNAEENNSHRYYCSKSWSLQ